MTKSISLESKIELFRDILNEGWGIGDYRYGIPDFKVMQKLECTPQSWARYRPQLIQYCQYQDLIKVEVREGIEIETIRICMRYDKKAKLWYGKKNSLMLDDKEKHTWRTITPEELGKYGIYWYAEDDFMY